jgi:hypothetical protein
LLSCKCQINTQTLCKTNWREIKQNENILKLFFRFFIASIII